MKQAMYLGGAALLAILSFDSLHPLNAGTPCPRAMTPADGMMRAVHGNPDGTLTGTLTSTLTMTRWRANFDWSAIPSALVPADTTFWHWGWRLGKNWC